jgi:hypothetical protein
MSCRLALVAILALSAGCKKKHAEGASCDQAGARFAANVHRTVGEAETAKDTDAKGRQTLDDTVPAMRDAMVRACKEHGWPAETRQCFADAADGAAETACYESMPPELRAKLDQASATPVPAP